MMQWISIKEFENSHMYLHQVKIGEIYEVATVLYFAQKYKLKTKEVLDVGKYFMPLAEYRQERIKEILK